MTEPMDSKPILETDLTRRSFLKGAGVTSIGVAIAGRAMSVEKAHADSPKGVVGPAPLDIELKVNGKRVKVSVEPRTTLAEALRDSLHLTGTKIGCDRGSCGSCTVIVDGKAVVSCMTLALDAVDLPIESIEGLADGENLHPLQEAFCKHDALQCGFCTPGMIMSCKSLLDHNQNPTLEEIQQGISGNICRCGTYNNVFKAVTEISGN
jgi:xanthine dehydrogenase YagT iron-sulfur-binding subunit